MKLKKKITEQNEKKLQNELFDGHYALFPLREIK